MTYITVVGRQNDILKLVGSEDIDGNAVTFTSFEVDASTTYKPTKNVSSL